MRPKFLFLAMRDRNPSPDRALLSAFTGAVMSAMAYRRFGEKSYPVMVKYTIERSIFPSFFRVTGISRMRILLA